MLLPFFNLSTMDAYNTILDIGSNLDDFDARISNSFIETMTQEGIFYSRALIDFEDLLLAINVSEGNKY
ncbi:hypothetical protein ALNOE001_01650 [Candidatus Methanobinarius endosymbioticus]|uniref:Uncharacterized protein n=1 Tax=Candidatus Methanobinarius endosymbioticus TaxID=2006182 RepID=A0A366MFQ2_9EURY|nr:hypothetical protein ALNOE001_01650 [Candidatus Methanobinarius endosymbioticus]